MMGWTFLLIWADRKPVERKGVLLLTIFPVITGLMIAGIVGAVMGISPISIPSSILGMTLIVLMGFSYFAALGKPAKQVSRSLRSDILGLIVD